MQTFLSVLSYIASFVSFIASLVTILAGSIAIYVFFAKTKEVKLLFNALINYSYQTTLYDLKEKLDRLNEYNAGNPDAVSEIINILHEIAGQIRGNTKLKSIENVSDLLRRIDLLVDKKTPKISEPQKRSLVSEIREVIKNLNVDSIETYL